MTNLTIVCSWCGLLMVEGGPEVSHSICPTCLARQSEIGDLAEDLTDIAGLVSDILPRVGRAGADAALEALAPELSALRRELHWREECAELVGEIEALRRACVHPERLGAGRE